MAIRSGLSLLAVAAILGGTAFYLVGASEKGDSAATGAAKPQSVETSAQSEEDALQPAEPDAQSSAREEEKPVATAAGEKGENAEAAPKEEEKAAPARSPQQVLENQALQLAFGDPKAPVKVVEFFSLSCPHCAQFYKDEQPKLIKDYVDAGKVYFVMRYFPHNGPGLGATILMQCVEDAKKKEFLAALFNMQDQWAFTNDFKKNLMSIAQIGGMGPGDFETCMADSSLEKKVLEQRQEALDVLKLEGIPSIFVNGKPMEGVSYGRLHDMIEKELAAQ